MRRKTNKRRWIAAAVLSLGTVVAIAATFAKEIEGLADIDLADLARTGGDTTIFMSNRNAFGKSAANLPVDDLREFAFGNRLFNTNWVTAPASVQTLDGLGPLFNRTSCSGCHTRDGRGRPPIGDEQVLISMLVRLSVPGETPPTRGVVPHPVYGDQLQDRAILGVPAEGRVCITWQPVPGAFDDGTPYELRRPRFQFVDLGYGSMGEIGKDVLISARVASQVYGVGLLEAVPQEAILALADPNDTNGDGISGRPNHVWDIEKNTTTLGRFGWKANQPSLRQQIASAFAGDIGITSSLTPHTGITPTQTAAAEASKILTPPPPPPSHPRTPPTPPTPPTPELSDEFFDKIVFYNATLAPPASRNLDSDTVQRGRALFFAANCHACHTPEIRTGSYPTHTTIPALANQTIRPYTDLLLHDMGEGLADDRPDFKATGREWRTPPLWGLGLVPIVNRHSFYLHDGRARNLEEAVLWHGGEAEESANHYRAMPAEDRAALIALLKAL